jgi:hypothetical protein
MFSNQIILTSESSQPKLLSTYHCVSCGRIEYGTVADITVDQTARLNLAEDLSL